MRLMGAGADAGRHRESPQAGGDACFTHPLGIVSLASSCPGSMKGMGGKLWRRISKKDLGGGLETRKYDLVGKLRKARIHGHSNRPSMGCAALPVLRLERAADRVPLPEKPPGDMSRCLCSQSTPHLPI